MKILSDTFKIEATYDELLFMYEGMMKSFDEIIESNGGIFGNDMIKKDDLCFELAIILGKKEEFLEKRKIQREKSVEQ